MTSDEIRTVDGSPNPFTPEPARPANQPWHPDDSSGERIARSLVCVHEELHLPTRLETWDEKDRLLGAYGYRDLRLNVGLTDSDFDVSNDGYGF